MSVPDENLTKCTLSVQRSPQALSSYHTILFPPPLHSSEKACKRESRYDYFKSAKYYKPFFYDRETKYLKFT